MSRWKAAEPASWYGRRGGIQGQRSARPRPSPPCNDWRLSRPSLPSSAPVIGHIAPPFTHLPAHVSISRLFTCSSSGYTALLTILFQCLVPKANPSDEWYRRIPKERSSFQSRVCTACFTIGLARAIALNQWLNWSFSSFKFTTFHLQLLFEPHLHHVRMTVTRLRFSRNRKDL